MRLGDERVGPQGLLLLAVTGILGLALAINGYGHGTTLAGAANALPPSQLPATSQSPTSRPKTSASSTTSGPSTSTTTGPAHQPSPSASGGAQKVGPLLSSTPYAPYAYQLYPGPVSPQAHLSTAGFGIHISRVAGNISVNVSVIGSPQPAHKSTYPSTYRVYFIEATFGDDSGDADYNYGDDGLVVTTPAGRIVQ
jgi:hypothetical protein